MFRADFRKSCCFVIPTAVKHYLLLTHITVAGSQVDKHLRLFFGCRSLLGFGSGLLLSGRLRLLGSRRLLGFGYLLGDGLLGCLEL